MRLFQTIAVLLATMLLPASGFAGVISDQASKAEQLLDSGQSNEAFEALDAAVEDFWSRSPMFVRKALFVSEIRGYGSYEEKDAVFKVGEPLKIYVEPIAFAYGKSADGQSVAAWSVDFALTGPKETKLIDQADFLDLELPLVPKTREINLELMLDLEGLKPGKYTSSFLLKDQNSDKKAEFSLPFEVIE